MFPMMGGIPVVVKNLLIINGLAFLATIVFQGRFDIDVYNQLGLFVITSPNFEIYQVITHMFLHGGFLHLFLNMFILFMFGSVLEHIWGPRRFLSFYLLTGIGAAFLHVLVTIIEIAYADPQTAQTLQQIPTVGASGAIFGLLMAFAMFFPDQRLYLMAVLPIKAKYLVLGLIIFELVRGLGDPGSGIAHFAHLGGMLFGYILIKFWYKW